MRLIGRNFGLKLFALVAAIFLWMVFSGTRELTESVSVPVQYRNLPRQLDISSDMVEQVHLTLRGSAPRLSRMNPAMVPVVIDLSNVHHPGERTFSVGEGNLKLPSGVVLDRVVPSQIRLRLEHRISRQVSVRVRITGLNETEESPPLSVQPSVLLVSGPESRVNRVEEVQTDPVDIESLRGGRTVRTQAYSEDPQVRFTAPPTVAVKTIVPETKK